MPQKSPFFAVFSISFSKVCSTKMFHTHIWHVSRTTTHTNAPHTIKTKTITTKAKPVVRNMRTYSSTTNNN